MLAHIIGLQALPNLYLNAIVICIFKHLISVTFISIHVLINDVFTIVKYFYGLQNIFAYGIMDNNNNNNNNIYDEKNKKLLLLALE